MRLRFRSVVLIDVLFYPPAGSDLWSLWFFPHWQLPVSICITAESPSKVKDQFEMLPSQNSTFFPMKWVSYRTHPKAKLGMFKVTLSYTSENQKPSGCSLRTADVFPVVTSLSPKRNSEVKLKPKKPDALAGYTAWGRGRGRKEKRWSELPTLFHISCVARGYQTKNLPKAIYYSPQPSWDLSNKV